MECQLFLQAQYSLDPRRGGKWCSLKCQLRLAHLFLQAQYSLDPRRGGKWCSLKCQLRLRSVCVSALTSRVAGGSCRGFMVIFCGEQCSVDAAASGAGAPASELGSEEEEDSTLCFSCSAPGCNEPLAAPTHDGDGFAALS
jgi:hypothetical protein